MKGFSAANIWRIKLFDENYSGSQKLARLVREIGWGHNIVIFEKCKDDLEREFYVYMAKAPGWSRSVLVHHLENQTYQQTLLNQTNFARTLPAEYQGQMPTPEQVAGLLEEIVVQDDPRGNFPLAPVLQWIGAPRRPFFLTGGL